MPNKDSGLIKIGTYKDLNDPVVFPKAQNKIIFNKEADNFLKELLKEKLNNGEEVPNILYNLFLKEES